jgi:hypothetical protein
VAEEGHHRRHELGLHRVEEPAAELGFGQVLGHAGGAGRLDGVDGQLLVEPLERLVLERHAAQGETGVVHQDVEPAERVDRSAHRTPGTVLVS